MFPKNNWMIYRTQLCLIISAFLILAIGCSSNGKKELRKTYYSSGELRSIGYFILDSIPSDSLITFFRDGKRSSLEMFNDSGSPIRSISYYENGHIHKLINYKNGLANGFFYLYDSTGYLKSKSYYFNDTQIGDIYFYYPDSLIYNFYDWKGNNISQIVYDKNFNILNDQRQIIFLDSIKVANDTALKDGNINNKPVLDLILVISKPPKCKTDLHVKYLSKKGNLLHEYNVTNIHIFQKKSHFTDSLGSIIILGQQYDSITMRITDQLSTKTLSYNLKLLSEVKLKKKRFTSEAALPATP